MIVYWKYDYINSIDIWERDTEKKMERYIYCNKDTELATGRWQIWDYDTIKEESGDTGPIITEISEEDAFLEMI